jgi:hypothetical protein
MGDGADLEPRGRDRAVEVERPPVVLGVLDPGKQQQQIADRLVRHLAAGPTDEHVVGELLRFLVAPRPDQLAHPWQTGAGLGIIAVIRRSGEETVFVELDAFIGDSAEHHRAQPAIAQRQRLHPFGRRGIVP